MSARDAFAFLLVIASSVSGLSAQVTTADLPSSHIELAGVWELRMNGECGVQADSTVGVLSLSTLSEPLRGFWVSMSEASHAGVYNAELDRAGVRTELMQPIAAARADGADSVRIVLNPGPAHGAVLLLGAITGDSIKGRWYQTGYFEGASGCFALLRMSSRTDWARLARYYNQLQRRGGH